MMPVLSSGLPVEDLFGDETTLEPSSMLLQHVLEFLLMLLWLLEELSMVLLSISSLSVDVVYDQVLLVSGYCVIILLVFWSEAF